MRCCELFLIIYDDRSPQAFTNSHVWVSYKKLFSTFSYNKNLCSKKSSLLKVFLFFLALTFRKTRKTIYNFLSVLIKWKPIVSVDLINYEFISMSVWISSCQYFQIISWNRNDYVIKSFNLHFNAYIIKLIGFYVILFLHKHLQIHVHLTKGCFIVVQYINFIFYVYCLES